MEICVICKKEFQAIDEEHLMDEGYICSAKCYKKTDSWKEVRRIISQNS